MRAKPTDERERRKGDRRLRDRRVEDRGRHEGNWRRPNNRRKGERPALLGSIHLDTIVDPPRFNSNALFSHPAGEKLPTDPGTDRVAAALKARAQSYRQAEDANWLIEGTDVPVRKSM